MTDYGVWDKFDVDKAVEEVDEKASVDELIAARKKITAAALDHSASAIESARRTSDVLRSKAAVAALREKGGLASGRRRQQLAPLTEDQPITGINSTIGNGDNSSASISKVIDIVSHMLARLMERVETLQQVCDEISSNSYLIANRSGSGRTHLWTNFQSGVTLVRDISGFSYSVSLLERQLSIKPSSAPDNNLSVQAVVSTLSNVSSAVKKLILQTSGSMAHLALQLGDCAVAADLARFCIKRKETYATDIKSSTNGDDGNKKISSSGGSSTGSSTSGQGGNKKDGGLTAAESVRLKEQAKAEEAVFWMIRTLAFAGMGSAYLASLHCRRVFALASHYPHIEETMKYLEKCELRHASYIRSTPLETTALNEVDRILIRYGRMLGLLLPATTSTVTGDTGTSASAGITSKKRSDDNLVDSINISAGADIPLLERLLCEPQHPSSSSATAAAVLTTTTSGNNIRGQGISSQSHHAEDDNAIVTASATATATSEDYTPQFPQQRSDVHKLSGVGNESVAWGSFIGDVHALHMGDEEDSVEYTAANSSVESNVGKQEETGGDEPYSVDRSGSDGVNHTYAYAYVAAAAADAEAHSSSSISIESPSTSAVVPNIAIVDLIFEKLKSSSSPLRLDGSSEWRNAMLQLTRRVFYEGQILFLELLSYSAEIKFYVAFILATAAAALQQRIDQDQDKNQHERVSVSVSAEKKSSSKPEDSSSSSKASTISGGTSSTADPSSSISYLRSVITASLLNIVECKLKRLSADIVAGKEVAAAVTLTPGQREADQQPPNPSLAISGAEVVAAVVDKEGGSNGIISDCDLSSPPVPTPPLSPLLSPLTLRELTSMTALQLCDYAIQLEDTLAARLKKVLVFEKMKLFDRALEALRAVESFVDDAVMPPSVSVPISSGGGVLSDEPNQQSILVKRLLGNYVLTTATATASVTTGSQTVRKNTSLSSSVSSSAINELSQYFMTGSLLAVAAAPPLPLLPPASESSGAVPSSSAEEIVVAVAATAGAAAATEGDPRKLSGSTSASNSTSSTYMDGDDSRILLYYLGGSGGFANADDVFAVDKELINWSGSRDAAAAEEAGSSGTMVNNQSFQSPVVVQPLESSPDSSSSSSRKEILESITETIRRKKEKLLFLKNRFG